MWKVQSPRHSPLPSKFGWLAYSPNGTHSPKMDGWVVVPHGALTSGLFTPQAYYGHASGAPSQVLGPTKIIVSGSEFSHFVRGFSRIERATKLLAILDNLVVVITWTLCKKIWMRCWDIQDENVTSWTTCILLLVQGILSKSDHATSGYFVLNQRYSYQLYNFYCQIFWVPVKGLIVSLLLWILGILLYFWCYVQH